MTYRFWANALTFFHFFWTFVVIGGGILMILYHPFAPYELAILGVTSLANIPFGNICPLTLWEEKLRKKFDPDYTNNQSFMATYLNKIFKTDLKPKSVSRVTVLFYILAYSLAVFILINH